jgi:hypothetical protein
MAEIQRAGTPVFRKFEKCYLNVSFLKIIHAHTCHLDTDSSKTSNNKYDCTWPTPKKNENGTLLCCSLLWTIYLLLIVNNILCNFCLGYILLCFKFKLGMHMSAYILYTNDLCRILKLFSGIVLILLFKLGFGTPERQIFLHSVYSLLL